MPNETSSRLRPRCARATRGRADQRWVTPGREAATLCVKRPSLLNAGAAYEVIGVGGSKVRAVPPADQSRLSCSRRRTSWLLARRREQSGSCPVAERPAVGCYAELTSRPGKKLFLRRFGKRFSGRIGPTVTNNTTQTLWFSVRIPVSGWAHSSNSSLNRSHLWRSPGGASLAKSRRRSRWSGISGG